MFSKLRNRLNEWAKKVSNKSEVDEQALADTVARPEEDEQALADTVARPEEKKKEIKKRERREKKLKKREEKKSKKIKEKPEKEEKIKKRTSSKKVRVSEKNFEIYSEELQLLLLENNVAYEVAEKIISELKERIINEEFSKKEIVSEINGFFREILGEILIKPFDLAEEVKKFRSEKSEPYVILFCGINGSGKTTTLAKIANYLKKNNFSCVLSASDTFRAASIEQINKHGARLGVKVISQNYGADPAAVSFDAVQYAKKHSIDVVLVDTAGRMHNAKNLMNELEKINRVIKPNLRIFVGESITGNDSIEQIRSFDNSVEIDGIILTKADVDEKGGTALSLSYIVKKPVLFLGVGQEYDKIEKFSKKKFLENLGL